MRSSGAMSFSSAATSSCAIAFSSVSFASCVEVLEDRGRILPRQHAEHDDLVLDAQLRQQRRELARMTVADHVAQPRVVARTQHRGEFVGEPGDLANDAQRLVALRSVELLFHLS